MRKLFILKLGGSIITSKSEGTPSIKIEEIKRIAKEIKAARKKRFFDLVLVHGAGSFGHGLAKQYKLWAGITEKSQILPYSKTQTQTVTLNNSLLQIFADNDLPVIAINPTEVIFQSNRKILTFDIKVVSHFLRSGFIPVLYGTVVPDKKLVGSICSGDTIVNFLANKLKANKSYFATDVDGIFTSDPNTTKDVKLIKNITDKNYSVVIKGTGKSASKIDVGGGMKGKLEEIKVLAPNVETWIFNGSKKGAIYKILSRKNVYATRIYLGK